MGVSGTLLLGGVASSQLDRCWRWEGSPGSAFAGPSPGTPVAQQLRRGLEAEAVAGELAYIPSGSPIEGGVALGRSSLWVT